MNPLENEKIGKLVMKFSLPCIISLLVSALYNIVDQVFIGQGVGYLGNAATNVVYPITVIILGLGLLIGDGAAAYLSLCLGKKEQKEARKGIGNAVTFSIIVSIIIFILCFIFQSSLLKMFGVTPNIQDYAREYMFWIVIGLPFYMFTNAMNSIIRADGNPKFAMITMLTGAVINLILDPVAIFILHAGVRGAAIATVIGQVVSAIMSFCYIKHMKSIKLEKKDYKLDFKMLKKFIPLGLSSLITQISICVVVILYNNILITYGAMSKYGAEIPLSALGIVMKVNGILINIAVGFGAGTQPIIGYNYGAKNYDRVKKTLYMISKLSMGITAIFFIIFQFCPQVVINIFGSESALYNEFASKCFRIFLMLCVLNSMQVVSGIFFQAIGKPVKSTVASLIRQIIFLIPAVLILTGIMGIDGSLWAGPVADGLAFIITIILLVIEVRGLKTINNKRNEEVTLSNNKNLVITIGREFGSGGKYIGEELAKRLNIKCYDDEILTKVAKETNMSLKDIKDIDEKEKKSFWYNYALTISKGDKNYLSSLPKSEQVFVEESRIIENLANNKSCIIIGRCSNYVLKDCSNTLNIFIYATDPEFKIERKQRFASLNRKDAIKMMEKIDKERSEYYKSFTNQEWGNKDNYDLFIDTSKLGIENSIELILQYIKYYQYK